MKVPHTQSHPSQTIRLHRRIGFLWGRTTRHARIRRYRVQVELDTTFCFCCNIALWLLTDIKLDSEQLPDVTRVHF